MSYLECKFRLNPFEPYNEIIVAQLSELGFESFAETNDEVLAYIQLAEFNESIKNACSEMAFQGVEIAFEMKEIPKENWNQKWENSFEPVLIDDFCIIRAPFHQAKSDFKHEIIIEPKMSFGTGHHATTQLMVKLMSSIKIEGSKVIDMGSGTGVLAILAAKMKASQVDAIDIEEWAFENIQENIERNDTLMVKPYLGGAEVLNQMNKTYDVFLANINKNILLRDIPLYDLKINKGGSLLLSGFFVFDAEELVLFMEKMNYKLLSSDALQDWSCLHFKKC
ncbi:MAG: 50S ribosomal protein L11 methyltransferase [Bacteroidetes bacterium]|nr:MAG: 50S ribosomal protein L11 methyltransferase [Bacteroidota bacterium]MBL1144759.1 50S ribosomal protein L11 methyltransferase [Bacteroidota bacterium]MCB0802991.1 50S ribosomal protein L11 methyltransferase [Flavobacteriales bacterium]NOG57553.1 50S ribosomal protein L11 methyltransferase [Bacteroidota bacterium]